MSPSIYRVLLRLFPRELRRWEQDMVEAFTLQLSDARREAGWMGELQVWYCAVAEIFRIALPLQAARGALVIPIVSVASSGAVFFGLTWALQNSLALHVAYRHWLDKLGG